MATMIRNRFGPGSAYSSSGYSPVVGMPGALSAYFRPREVQAPQYAPPTVSPPAAQARGSVNPVAEPPPAAAAMPNRTATAQDVIAFYRAYLGRDPENQGAIDGRVGLPLATLARQFATSPEYALVRGAQQPSVANAIRNAMPDQTGVPGGRGAAPPNRPGVTLPGQDAIPGGWIGAPQAPRSAAAPASPPPLPGQDTIPGGWIGAPQAPAPPPAASVGGQALTPDVAEYLRRAGGF